MLTDARVLQQEFISREFDDRLDPLLPVPDFLASALVLMFREGVLDPPD